MEISKFLDLLLMHQIQVVADVRAFPSSKKFPQFNLAEHSVSLNEHSICYEHFPGLGGKRKPLSNSRNLAWRNESFRGYADYMETAEFSKEIDKLMVLAIQKRTVILCAETLWWKCHRALIADYLKVKGVDVTHILANGKLQQHHFSTPALVRDGTLTYRSLEF